MEGACDKYEVRVRVEGAGKTDELIQAGHTYSYNRLGFQISLSEQGDIPAGTCFS